MTGVTFDPSEILRLLNGVRTGVRTALRSALHVTIGSMVAHVVKKRLIRANPPYLNRRTGTLIRSITASPRVETAGDRLSGSWGTNLEYGRRHEEGFEGNEHVFSHVTRRHRVRAHIVMNAFGSGFNLAFSASTRGPTYVRGHTRHVRLRPRHYIADTIQEDAPLLERNVTRSLEVLLNTGKPPSASQLQSGG